MHTQTAVTYIDEVATKIYNHGSALQNWERPDDQVMPLYRTYAVLALNLDPGQITMQLVHDAWSAWITGIDPQHRSLIPFANLAPEVQDLDLPYVRAICAVSREVRRG